MISFNLIKTPCTVEHVNLRKQKNNADEIVAVDVKLTCKAEGPPVLQAILGAADEGRATMAFWDILDQDKSALFTGITHVESWAEYAGSHKVRFGRHSVRATKVGKFRFTPLNEGMIELTFSISVDAPPVTLIKTLARALKDELTVDVLADPVLLDNVA